MMADNLEALRGTLLLMETIDQKYPDDVLSREYFELIGRLSCGALGKGPQIAALRGPIQNTSLSIAELLKLVNKHSENGAINIAMLYKELSGN